MQELICLCRETSKKTGGIAAYAIDTEVNNRLLFVLNLRQRINIELKYFITTRDNFEENGEEILALLSRKIIDEQFLKEVNVAAI